MPKLFEVKAHCHQCDKFRIRTALDDEYDTENLIDATVRQLQEVDQCPHTEQEMEISTYVTKQKRIVRRKSKFHVG